MGDEVQTIQQETQRRCLSKHFSCPVANEPVFADPVIASNHGIGPNDNVVKNSHLIGYCDTIVDTDRLNHVNEFSSSIPNPITDSNRSTVVNKHVIDPIVEGPSIASDENVDTDVQTEHNSEYNNEALTSVTTRTIDDDQDDNIKHQTLSVAIEERTMDVNTVGTSLNEDKLRPDVSTENLRDNVAENENKQKMIRNFTETSIQRDQYENTKHHTLQISMAEKTVENNAVGTSTSEGQAESEVTAAIFDNSVVKTSVSQYATEGTEPQMNNAATYAGCKSFYPQSVREVSALLQQARCLSPPQISPPPPTPQLAAVAASSSHSCGSLYAQCGANYHEPVSLNEILTEREHLPSYYRYHLDAIDYQSQDPLEEDEEALLREYHKQQQRFLMGNGVSAGPCSAPSSNTAVTAGNGDGQNQRISPIGSSSVFRVSQPEDYDYFKGLVPQLKREAKDWEAKSDSLEAEVLELRKELRMREQEIVRLQREVHKLKVSTMNFVNSNFFVKTEVCNGRRAAVV